MYSLLPSFILGFHGCDEAVAEAVLAGKQHLKPSSNEYDWLGTGIYFWENSPTRALEYARLLKDHPRPRGAKVLKPTVVGAIINLGYCLNLLDSKFLNVVQDGYASLAEAMNQADIPLPMNKRVGPRRELLLRDLDCAVINAIHTTRKQEGLPEFDSVRAAFIEGKELYPGAGFFDHNHIQVCIRNPRCIKGYFRPLPDPDLIDAV